MLWAQAGVCFLIWVGYGWWMRRSGPRLRQRLAGSSRTFRTLLGSVGLLIGLALLIGGIYAIAALGGLGESGLKPWAWLAVAVVGTVFVHIQVIGAAAMVSLAYDQETDRPSETSNPQEKDQR